MYPCSWAACHSRPQKAMTGVRIGQNDLLGPA
jgi:hypothetical protein